MLAHFSVAYLPPVSHLNFKLSVSHRRTVKHRSLHIETPKEPSQAELLDVVPLNASFMRASAFTPRHDDPPKVPSRTRGIPVLQVPFRNAEAVCEK
jgi:hypothetical protein